MSSLNRSPSFSRAFAQSYGKTEQNHHGLRVNKISAEAQLKRLTMAHMLWEKQFYVDGKSSADTIASLVDQVSPAYVADLAKQARSEFKLRHVPLLLMRSLAKKGALKGADLAEVIQRPDEMSEFLSMYWKDKKEPVSNQVKKGLATAFKKFNEYSLAKWDKNSAAISLRDVMFITHPKPDNAEQEALFKKVANKELETPDTWETELSGGADKRGTFTRLMAERKLGALAFLRNLRNMSEAGVSEQLIREYSQTVNLDRVLPFRFIAAARIVPQFQDMLEAMMFKSLEGHDKLKGKTVLLVDCSGSMFGTKVTEKSDLDRFDAAAALAILCREICEDVVIYGFANNSVKVDSKKRGFALVDAIRSSTSGGTDLRQSVETVKRQVGKMDRLIVFTDEQSSTAPTAVSSSKNYIINVGSYKNGINDYEWLTITGFSEAVLDYLLEYEKQG